MVVQSVGVGQLKVKGNDVTMGNRETLMGTSLAYLCVGSIVTLVHGESFIMEETTHTEKNKRGIRRI